MTREEANFIGAMNMCDEISNEAYKKIMCHCEEQESVLDKIRAEIDELYSYVEFDEDIKTSFNMVRLEEVQRVINKYRTESEVEDV